MATRPSQARPQRQQPQRQQPQQSIQDDSPVLGFYDRYVVTRDSSLVGGLSVSGINLDLLSTSEQSEVFAAWESVLVAWQRDEYQVLTTTEPADLETYLKYQKRAFVAEPDPTRKNLIASYVDTYTRNLSTSQLISRRHYVLRRQPIHGPEYQHLQAAAQALRNRLDEMQRTLTKAFEAATIRAGILTAQDLYDLLAMTYNYSDYQLLRARG